ncbi:MAG: hypothetical protein ACI4C3_01135 [Bacteroides sp.]
MGQDLSNKFFEVLQKHLDSGVPLKDMQFTDIQLRRAEICLDVYNRLQQNHMMDVGAYLRNKYHRSITEIRQDKKVIEYLMNELNSGGKALARYRMGKTAENIIRQGMAAGDWKAQEAGGKMLEKAYELDKPEQGEDIANSIHELPPVFTTDPTKINRNKQRYSEDEIEKLRRKYHVQKDSTMEMVETKRNFYVQASLDMLDRELEKEYGQPDEEEEDEECEEYSEGLEEE